MEIYYNLLLIIGNNPKFEPFWDTSLRTFQKFVAASPHCRVVMWEEKDLLKIADTLDLHLD